MPNWCDNRLTIVGSKTDIQSLKTQLAEPSESNAGDVTSDLFLMSMAKPWGSEQEKEKYLSSNDAWYDMNIAYWGTKWDVEANLNAELSNETTLVYDFLSAWSPPLAAVATCSSQWPDAVFVIEYDEPGMDFAGRFEYEAGEKIASIESESRTYYCDICESSSKCDWDSPIQCMFTGAEISDFTGGDEFPVILHMITEASSNSEDVASALKQWVSLVESGSENMPPWRQGFLEEAFRNSTLGTLEDRRILMESLASNMPTWLASALLAGLTDEEIESARLGSSESLRLIAHLGTVGHILES